MPRVPGDEPAVGAGNLGQHQVDDVLGQLVLAAGDPHLVAAQAVARAERIGLEVVAVGHRARRHVRQAGTRLRLRQRHGAEPASGELGGGEHLALRRRAVRHQQPGVALGQHGVAAERDAGLREERVGRHLDADRQLHAARLVRLRGGEHAALGIGAGGVEGGLRQMHALAVEARLLGVDETVERRELLARDALAGVEHRVEGLAASGRRSAAARRAQPTPSQSWSRKSRVCAVAHGGRVSGDGAGRRQAACRGRVRRRTAPRRGRTTSSPSSPRPG